MSTAGNTPALLPGVDLTVRLMTINEAFEHCKKAVITEGTRAVARRMDKAPGSVHNVFDRPHPWGLTLSMFAEYLRPHGLGVFIAPIKPGESTTPTARKTVKSSGRTQSEGGSKKK